MRNDRILRSQRKQVITFGKDVYFCLIIFVFREKT